MGLAQLRALEDLNLSHNQLQSLPYNFGEIAFLDTLDLSNNQLEELPNFSNLVLLEDLYLANNRLKVILFSSKVHRILIALVAFQYWLERTSPRC